MSTETQLATRDAEPSRPQPLQIVQEMNRRGTPLTMEDVAVVRELMTMQKEMDAEAAKRAWNASYIQLRQTLPVITMTKIIPSDDGSERCQTISLPEIRAIADPYLDRFGFSIFMDQESSNGYTTTIATVLHSGGHERTTRFTVKDSKPPKCSDSQGSMSSASFADRGAYCHALGIRTEKMTDGSDARGLGEYISTEDAAALRKRLQALGRDEESFLIFAKGSSFDTIPEAMLSACQAMLSKAEKVKPKSKFPPNPGTAPCDDEGNLL